MVNGDGEQTRDYVYVGDVVRANILAAEMVLGQELPIVNIGTGVETSVNILLQLLRESAGRHVAWRHGPPRPGEQRRSVLDCTLAKRVLGWEAATNLRTGLSRTFEWFSANRKAD